MDLSVVQPAETPSQAPLAVHDEVDEWFSRYLAAFVDIGTGKVEPAKILLYWGVPLHTSRPKDARWLTSSEDVVNVLIEMHRVLKNLGYTHTEAIDKSVTIYSDNAARVEAIMSRRRGDGAEVDRAAVSFEMRRADGGWIIISTAAKPTSASVLRDVW